MKLHVDYRIGDEPAPEDAPGGHWRIVEELYGFNGEGAEYVWPALYPTRVEACNAVARAAFGDKP